MAKVEIVDPGKCLPQIEQALAEYGIETFADLFQHPSPSEMVLGHVRRYAENLISKGPDVFPTEVAQVVYTLSLLCRLQTRKKPPPANDAASFANLGRWCLAQIWLDDGTRRILRQRLG